HDFVRIVAKNGAKAAGKCEALFLVDRNLSDAPHLIFHGIFDGDDFVFVVFDFVDRRVESSRFPRTGGSGDEHHTVRLMNIAAEAGDFVMIEAHHIESEGAEFFAKGFLVQDAQHGVLTMDGGHDGDAEIDEASFVLDPKTAVLGRAALGNVQLAHDLDAGQNCAVPAFRVSMWTSLALRSRAVKMTVSTRRTTGLTPVSPRVSFSMEMFSSLSSSSPTTWSVKPSVAWSSTR